MIPLCGRLLSPNNTKLEEREKRNGPENVKGWTQKNPGGLKWLGEGGNICTYDLGGGGLGEGGKLWEIIKNVRCILRSKWFENNIVTQYTKLLCVLWNAKITILNCQRSLIHVLSYFRLIRKQKLIV